MEWLMGSDFVKSLCKVIDDVIHMLCTDAEADAGRIDVLFLQFLRTHLGVGGGGRMDDEALHVGTVLYGANQVGRAEGVWARPCCRWSGRLVLVLRGVEGSQSVVSCCS